MQPLTSTTGPNLPRLELLIRDLDERRLALQREPAESRRLDAPIHQSHDEERATFLRRLNTIQSSTRNLPPEILSSIFQCTSLIPSDFYVRTGYTEPSEIEIEAHAVATRLPIVLASISSLWRNVAFSTPKIWTHLVLNIRRSSTIIVAVDILEFYLKNIGVDLISLHLYFRPERPFRLETLENAIFTERNVAKFRNLEISPYPLLWRSSLPVFPHLRNLVLRRFKLMFKPVYLKRPPALRSLVLQNMSPLISLNSQLWANLITLVLHQMPFEFCMKIFTLCPLLCEYRVQSPNPPLGPLNQFLRDVTMQFLEVFEWDRFSIRPYMTVERMFTGLSLPILRILALEIPSNHDILEHLLVFTSRIRTTLFSLELILRDQKPEYRKTLLSSLHGVRRLVLHPDSAIPPLLEIVDILRALHVNSDLPEIDNLPCLEEVCIVEHSTSSVTFGNIAGLRIEVLFELFTLLEHRKGIRKCRVYFKDQLVGDHGLKYPDLDILTRVDLKIYGNGIFVDYSSL